MRKASGSIFVLLSVLLLCGCEKTEFNGRRTGDDSRFIMEYETFNSTDSQSLTLKPGDRLRAEIVVERGSLAVRIQKDRDRPVYENDKIETSESFELEIREGGAYRVTVTGQGAKGSVSFQKLAEEKRPASPTKKRAASEGFFAVRKVLKNAEMEIYERSY